MIRDKTLVQIVMIKFSHQYGDREKKDAANVQNFYRMFMKLHLGAKLSSSKRIVHAIYRIFSIETPVEVGELSKV